MYSPTRGERTLWFFFTLICLAALTAIIWRGASTRLSGKSHWVIQQISADGSSMTVQRRLAPSPTTKSGQPASPPKPEVITVPQPLRATVLRFKVGDCVDIEAVAMPQAGTLAAISATSVPSGNWTRRIPLIGGALLVPVLAGLFIGAGPRGFLIGKDGRYSNSKTQAALWFTVLIGAYVSALLLRWMIGGAGFIGGVQIPTNLMMLSGLSVLTFAGAKWITTARVEEAARKGAKEAEKEIKPLVKSGDLDPPEGAAAVEALTEDAKDAVKPPNPSTPSLTNLVTDDQGLPDFGDFQMLVVTGLAVFVYLIQLDHFLGAMPFTKSITLPDVDTTLLATFGLGQGAYLIKKAAADTT